MFGCQNQHDSDASIEDFIPEGSELIIKIHSFEAFKSAVKNNPLLKLTDLEQVFETHLYPIDSLNISKPMLICKEELVINIIQKMNANKITCLFVVNNLKEKKPIGIIHIHDCIRYVN